MNSPSVINFSIRGLGHAPSFKNGKEIIRIKGRPSITTKQSRKSWMARALFLLRSQKAALRLPARLTDKRPTCQIKDHMQRLTPERDQAVSINVTLGISSLASADIDGALATVSDCLTRSGVLADDAPRYVKSLTVGWQPVYPGKENAQIAVTLD